jgi:hypothetical protein
MTKAKCSLGKVASICVIPSICVIQGSRRGIQHRETNVWLGSRRLASPGAATLAPSTVSEVDRLEAASCRPN